MLPKSGSQKIRLSSGGVEKSIRKVPDIVENAASGAIRWDYLEGANRNRVPVAEI